MSEAKHPATDWPAIEAAFRAGIQSLRTIAGEHGVAESTIRKRANREDRARDWCKDPSQGRRTGALCTELLVRKREYLHAHPEMLAVGAQGSAARS